MGLFGKLFSKRGEPEEESARRVFEQALKDSKKPQGPHKMALLGAETRQQLLGFIEEVEAEIGQTAIGVAQDVGVMMVHPKLIERLRKEPHGDLFETALPLAFPTPDFSRRYNEQWPSAVGKFRGRQNTEEILQEKSVMLVSYIINNCVAFTSYRQASEHVRELSDEQKTSVRLEEAALWNCVILQLAARYLGSECRLFMDYFEDFLANRLALQGAPLASIPNAIRDRPLEYMKYRKWFLNDDEGTGGTLLWEAAKHIGMPLDSSTNPFFLMDFGKNFSDRLKNALVYELLSGNLNSK
jgi:hypothetical protein